MASISAGEIFDVAKWAFDLWRSCKAAEGKFEQVSKEVYGMRTVIQIAHLHRQSPSSIINHVDDKKKTLRRQLGVYIQNCKQALSEAEALLERYKKMSVAQRITWALWGDADVADVVSNLSSFTTQLNTFNNSLTLEGIGVVNTNVLRGFAAILKGIDRIEEALEENDGDEKVAMTEVMQEIRGTGVSREEAKTYHDIIEGYAREVCPKKNLLPTRRAQTPDSSRGRDPDPNFLNVTPAAPRRRSVNSSPGGRQVKNRKTPFLGRPGGKKPDYTLQCWLVQVKSTEALFVTFQFSEKEKQTRGQWKLREMAEQFKASPQTSQLANDHELVNWVLQDTKKQEKNKDFAWYPHAAKMERKNSVYLGLGVERQAMIIIKRQMTPEAQRIAKEKVMAAKKKAAAEKAKPTKNEPQEGKRQPQKEKGQQKRQPQEGRRERKGQQQKGKRRSQEQPQEGKKQPKEEKAQQQEGRKAEPGKEKAKGKGEGAKSTK